MSDLNIKAHVVLLISYGDDSRPIDVAEIAAKYDLRHYVCVEPELKSDGHGGFVIDQAAKGHCTEVIHGQGKTISRAITDWLHNLACSMFYQPLYQKKGES